MKYYSLLFGMFGLAVFMSCGNQSVESSELDARNKDLSTKESEAIKEKPLNTDSLVLAVEEQRAAIEDAARDPMVVSTDDLKEKIKQKWKKIHFYTVDGKLARIKTYPYDEITNRTEEFYLQNGELFLAVIEDNGEGERGKAMKEIDKLYYFANGKLMHEVHKTEEREYSLRKSDAEELQTEVREYIDLYKSRSQN